MGGKDGLIRHDVSMNLEDLLRSCWHWSLNYSAYCISKSTLWPMKFWVQWTPSNQGLRVYSELPLIWTPEVWPPLSFMPLWIVPNRLYTTNSIQVPPWNEATPLIRTLWLVPRVVLANQKCKYAWHVHYGLRHENAKTHNNQSVLQF